jgi:hypothetical protein
MRPKISRASRWPQLRHRWKIRTTHPPMDKGARHSDFQRFHSYLREGGGAYYQIDARGIGDRSGAARVAPALVLGRCRPRQDCHDPDCRWSQSSPRGRKLEVVFVKLSNESPCWADPPAEWASRPRKGNGPLPGAAADPEPDRSLQDVFAGAELLLSLCHIPCRPRRPSTAAGRLLIQDSSLCWRSGARG